MKFRAIARLATGQTTRRSHVGRYTVSATSRGGHRASKIGRRMATPKVSRANNRPSIKRLPGKR